MHNIIIINTMIVVAKRRYVVNCYVIPETVVVCLTWLLLTALSHALFSYMGIVKYFFPCEGKVMNCKRKLDIFAAILKYSST